MDVTIVSANELYYTTDPLWDGDGCRYDASARVNCCTNPNLPWFFQYP